MNKTGMSKVFKKILYALIIFIVFGEFGLRLFKPFTMIYYPAGKTFPPIFIKSDTHSIGLKPNTVVEHCNYFNEFVKKYHINSKGLRGEAEDGGIIMLGDSFIFGIGLNENQTVPYYLREFSGLKVVNAGVPNYSVDNAYILLKNYSPDKIAIFGFFLDNDIKDIKDHDWITGKDGLPVKIIQKKASVDNTNRLTVGEVNIPPLKAFLRDNSIFYTVLSESRYRLKYKIGKTVSVLKNLKNKKNTPAITHFLEDADIIKIKHLFIAMKNMNDKFLVLLIPSKDKTPYRAELKKYIVDFFEKEKINYLCLPDKPDSLYYTRDCHLTDSGARHTAEIIYKKLKDLCWL